MADELEWVMTQLKLLNALGPAKLATRGSPAHRLHVLAGAGVLPGRQVIDTVTGQVATVLHVAVAYLPHKLIDEVNDG